MLVLGYVVWFGTELWVWALLVSGHAAVGMWMLNVEVVGVLSGGGVVGGGVVVAMVVLVVVGDVS